MPTHTSYLAIAIFLAFVGFTLGLSFFLGRKAKTAGGYFAAHGQIGWFVNGVAFAGDYLSAASFLGICGMIAFYGYDGFLYSIGFLAGWVVALFVIAEPIKRLGKYTFADALDAKFNSPGIRLAAGMSTLVVSLFYLIPQMVGAGSLIVPLLGIAHYWGVIIVGAVVILIVTTAGMVSTTWVQFIKGSMLVIFCAVLVILIIRQGFKVNPGAQQVRADIRRSPFPSTLPNKISVLADPNSNMILASTQPVDFGNGRTGYIGARSPKLKQIVVAQPDPAALAPPAKAVVQLGGGDAARTKLSPLSYISTLRDVKLLTHTPDKTLPGYYQLDEIDAQDSLVPGGYFKGIRGTTLAGKLDFISLMLALFCGTASLPHILIRYYTVKDAAAARKSTVVGIAAIGFFYVLTLYIGLGAMVSGNLDPADSNMAAPLLARTFGELPFALITAIAFTTVLGTVSGLILAAAGAVAHDICGVFATTKLTGEQQVNVAKLTSVVVGVIAIGLGILFKGLNVGFLVGWAFNVAASANLPAIVMLLFWGRTTRQGMIASILVGCGTSVAWLLLTKEAFQNVYGLTTHLGYMPFSQPGLVTIPLSFLVLVVVSLLTPRAENVRGFEVTP